MLNSIAFYLLAAFTLASAIAAMTLRNLVHCALCVASAFAGIAMIYLQLDAEFVGFAQVLVYIGAVAILIVFTVLLTRGAEVKPGVAFVSKSWLAGLIAAGLVFAGVVTPILLSPSLEKTVPEAVPSATVQQIGDKLMTDYVLPLEGIGLLLTAALLGGVVIAMQEKPEAPKVTTAPKKDLVTAGGAR
jgi:NADH:ubiquinone oxidoreductase subunit 6 (subunit J)